MTDTQRIAILKTGGLSRVLDGRIGMTFVVDKFTDTIDNRGRMAHVRDYRYPTQGNGFQIWSLGPEDYDLLPAEAAPE